MIIDFILNRSSLFCKIICAQKSSAWFSQKRLRKLVRWSVNANVAHCWSLRMIVVFVHSPWQKPAVQWKTAKHGLGVSARMIPSFAWQCWPEPQSWRGVLLGHYLKIRVQFEIFLCLLIQSFVPGEDTFFSVRSLTNNLFVVENNIFVLQGLGTRVKLSYSGAMIRIIIASIRNDFVIHYADRILRIVFTRNTNSIPPIQHLSFKFTPEGNVFALQTLSIDGTVSWKKDQYKWIEITIFSFNFW